MIIIVGRDRLPCRFRRGRAGRRAHPVEDGRGGRCGVRHRRRRDAVRRQPQLAPGVRDSRRDAQSRLRGLHDDQLRCASVGGGHGGVLGYDPGGPPDAAGRGDRWLPRLPLAGLVTDPRGTAAGRPRRHRPVHRRRATSSEPPWREVRASYCLGSSTSAMQAVPTRSKPMPSYTRATSSDWAEQKTVLTPRSSASRASTYVSWAARPRRRYAGSTPTPAISATSPTGE